MSFFMDVCRRGWVLAGASGLFMALMTGCAGDPALSMQLAGNTAEAAESAAPQTPDAESFLGFVRVNRMFFEQPLAGEIRINAAQAEKTYEVDSDVNWEVLAPTAPAPTGDYIADFRDREGCVTYQNTDGVQLCFVVMPDVSSVDVKEERMHVEGLQQLVAEQVAAQTSEDCSEALGEPKFVDAKKSGNALQVNFAVESNAPENSGCAVGPVQVGLALRQV